MKLNNFTCVIGATNKGYIHFNNNKIVSSLDILCLCLK